MSDARNVYIIIFVMLLLPIVFYMLRRRFRTKDTKKKARCLVYMSVMIVAAGGLCYGLYAYTIKTQPLLVAEQAAKALYQADVEEQDPKALLVEKNLMKEDGAIAEQEQGDWAQFAGATINMPDKTIELDGEKYYPIALDIPGSRALAAMKIQEEKGHTTVESIQVLWPDQIGDKLESITFFESGTLPD